MRYLWLMFGVFFSACATNASPASTQEKTDPTASERAPENPVSDNCVTLERDADELNHWGLDASAGDLQICEGETIVFTQGNPEDRAFVEATVNGILPVAETGFNPLDITMIRRHPKTVEELPTPRVYCPNGGNRLQAASGDSFDLNTRLVLLAKPAELGCE